IRIARHVSPGLNEFLASRQDSDAVPTFFASPDGVVSGLTNGGFRKLFLRRLQLLQANDIWRRFLKPSQDHRESAVYAVDVEGRYSHGGLLYAASSRRERTHHD